MIAVCEGCYKAKCDAVGHELEVYCMRPLTDECEICGDKTRYLMPFIKSDFDGIKKEERV